MGMFDSGRRGGSSVKGQYYAFGNDNIGIKAELEKAKPDTPITWQQPNPKQSDSASYDRYEVFSQAETCGEYLMLQKENFEKRFIKGDLIDGLRRGFVKIG